MRVKGTGRLYQINEHYPRGKDRPGWQGCGDIPLSYYKYLKKKSAGNHQLFDVSIEYLWDLWVKQNGRCYFSNLELYLPKDCRTALKNCSLCTIDRSIGYIESNVVWAHKDVSVMMIPFKDAAIFLEYCKKVKEWLQRKI